MHQLEPEESHRWKIATTVPGHDLPYPVSRGTACKAKWSPPLPPPRPPPSDDEGGDYKDKEEMDRDPPEQRDCVFVFGGCRNNSVMEPSNQICIYDLENGQWLDATTLLSDPSIPSASSASSASSSTSRWGMIKEKVKLKKVKPVVPPPHPRHSHAMAVSRNERCVYIFGGEGKRTTVSDPVYRAKSSIESKRINNAAAAGAPRYSGQRPKSPTGRLRYENIRPVRSFFGDLHCYSLEKSEWYDLHRQVPSRFVEHEQLEGDQQLKPHPRSGHSLVLMGVPMPKFDTGEDVEKKTGKDKKNIAGGGEKNETSPKRSPAGIDPDAGLSLKEMKIASNVRNPGLLVLYGGEEADMKCSTSSLYTSQSIEFEAGQSKQVASNQIWVFDLIQLTWSLVVAVGTPPPPTSHHTSEVSKNGEVMYVFGGEDELGNVIAGLHELKRIAIDTMSNQGKKKDPAMMTEEIKEEKVAEKTQTHVWRWTRIQLLAVPASPPASCLASMVLHPVEHDVLLIFGGSCHPTTTTTVAATTGNGAVPTKVAWRYNTKSKKWCGTALLENGPTQCIGGNFISSLELGSLWHWGGNSSSSSNNNCCFVSKLRKLKANDGASAKLKCTVQLNDPISDGQLLLPPVMGAISEEKNVMLLSLKSLRDSHALDLQRHCKSPSKSDWKKTRKIIAQVRKSRRNMLSASQSMATIIMKSHPVDDEEEEEEEEEEEAASFGISASSTTRSIQNRRTQSQGSPMTTTMGSSLNSSGGSSMLDHSPTGTSKMNRSRTAPHMKQGSLESLCMPKPPFMAASCSRACFDFGIHGLKTPRWSLNTLLDNEGSRRKGYNTDATGGRCGGRGDEEEEEEERRGRGREEEE